MKKEIKLIIIISIILNAVLCYFLFSKTDNINRTPPWHPFKLNSHLNLESIVKNGYKFSSSPCGQVQYTKQISDTIIQYEVEVDCNDYKGHFDQSELALDLDDEEVFPNPKKNIISKKKSKTMEEMISENKYYPWEINDIKNCYQQIKWRVYTINLGSKIDSLSLKKFIYKKGGKVISLAKIWNSKAGGGFMVHHSESNLYFHCTLDYRNDYNSDSDIKNWYFNIIRTIPFLDQNLINKNKEQRLKRDNYFNWDKNALQQKL